MATRNGLVQIKDLIKNGELSENHSYSHGFLFHCHGDIHAGRYTLEIDGRFVYFYAKRFLSQFPCCSFRVNRNTTLVDLDNYIQSAL